MLVRRKGVFNDFDVDFSEGRRLPAVHVLVPLCAERIWVFAWALARFELEWVVSTTEVA